MDAKYISPDRDGSIRDERLSEYYLLCDLTRNGARPDLEHEKNDLRDYLWPDNRKLVTREFKKWFDEFLTTIGNKNK